MAKNNKPADEWIKFIINTEMNGMTVLDAYKDVWGDIKSDDAIKSEVYSFKNTEVYRLLYDVAIKSASNSIEQKATRAIEKTFEAQASLLEQGDDAIRNADSHKDKLSAMLAQRENIAMSSSVVNVISQVADINRNKELPENTTVAGDAVIID